MRTFTKALLLAIMLLLPSASIANYDIQVGKILYSYVYENGEKTSKVMVADRWVNGNYPYNWSQYVGKITIPETIQYNNEEYTVVGIADNAFRISGITEVTLPSTVTYIGNYAFSGSKLERIDLSHITQIGTSAFSGTNIQDTIIWPSAIPYIPTSTFEGSRIECLILPETVTEIRANAFQNSSLRNIELPRTLHTLAQNAFWHSKLQSIDIPGSVENVSSECFAYCDSLRSAVLHEGTKVVGNGAFMCCTSLRGVILPDGLETIEPNSFKDCDSIRTFIVPEGVSRFERVTFNHALSLNTVIFPSTLKYLCEYSLCGCRRVQDIYCYAMLPPLTPGGGGSPFNCPGYAGWYSCNYSGDKDCHFMSYNARLEKSIVAHIPEEAGLYINNEYRDDDWSFNRWSLYEHFTTIGGTYTLTYMVDGEVYAQQRYPEGVQIDALGDIYRDNKTFNGWSEIPEHMPSHDVIVMGSFSDNLNPSDESNLNYNLTTSGYGTIVLPFDAELPKGVKAYTCTALDGQTVVMEEQSMVPACTPVVLVGTPGSYAFTGIGEASEVSYTYGLLTGVFNATQVEDGYVLQQQAGEIGFYCIDANAPKTVPANRCYLNIPATVKMLYLDVADIIESIKSENDEKTYDLTGRRVARNTPGVKVVKGRKVIKK